VDLREVIGKTKISHGYLRAIEEEDFAVLPALVYTRGFVAELAKYLRLDPIQVSKSYIRRYRRFLESRERDGA
jgi:flagellar biosynthesis protein FlhG